MTPVAEACVTSCVFWFYSVALCRHYLSSHCSLYQCIWVSCVFVVVVGGAGSGTEPRVSDHCICIGSTCSLILVFGLAVCKCQRCAYSSKTPPLLARSNHQPAASQRPVTQWKWSQDTTGSLGFGMQSPINSMMSCTTEHTTMSVRQCAVSPKNKKTL